MTKVESVFDLLGRSIRASLEEYKTFKQKKTKKCQLFLSIFIDAAKTVKNSQPTDVNALESNIKETIELVTKLTEEDKDLSNLKGRIKNLKSLLSETE